MISSIPNIKPKGIIKSRQTQLFELKFQNQRLLEQLGSAKKRKFGSSSEQIQEELMEQLAFSLSEAEA